MGKVLYFIVGLYGLSRPCWGGDQSIGTLMSSTAPAGAAHKALAKEQVKHLRGVPCSWSSLLTSLMQPWLPVPATALFPPPVRHCSTLQ